MGNEDDTKPQRRCVTCKGRGWIVLFVARSECPDCQGSGISPRKYDENGDPLEFDDETKTPPRGLKF